ncbi:DJ-1/PfpI family protein [Streptomyces sp. NPDC042638]|uniref:DJ-1/PfpI family protein n=1 Tax=Streptomyces sp. NPDC042638 TaxID=3154333 RepID=UPI0033EBC2FD
MTAYGLLLFEGVEELDFVGPWEVFTASAMVREQRDTTVLIAEKPGPVRCNKGMRVLPDHTFDDHPPLDVLLVPGGNGTRTQVSNPVLIEWIRGTSAQATWTTSVCTGALLLHEAGPARRRRAATHHAFEDTLEARGEITVVRDARYVVDGHVVTSQGVSAGIDMALWLIGRLHGRDHARAVRRYIQYEPAPPYLADEPQPTAEGGATWPASST